MEFKYTEIMLGPSKDLLPTKGCLPLTFTRSDFPGGIVTRTGRQTPTWFLRPVS